MSELEHALVIYKEGKVFEVVYNSEETCKKYLETFNAIKGSSEGFSKMPLVIHNQKEHVGEVQFEPLDASKYTAEVFSQKKPLGGSTA